ncbi:MAG: choice-of-anchor D domain-containing protein [Verrucomicrobia bacterium]|nr:choice-of-anchor D domain-containing protein [Verrucomicrobiota bacterium]
MPQLPLLSVRPRPLLRGALALLAVAVSLLPGPQAGAADGALDPSFVTDLRRVGSNGQQANPILHLSDGRILVFGPVLTNATGATLQRQLMLQTDGATDTSYSPILTTGGAQLAATTALMQPDGKILLGGAFDSVSGLPRLCVVRLNPDFSVDPSFVPPVIAASPGVGSLAVQADGKVIIVGLFTSVDGQARTRIARLNADGSLDAGFNPVFVRTGAAPTISTVEVQDDGKILVGGTFASVNGEPRANFVRLNPDGSNDPLTLDTNANVAVFLVQPNGRFIMGGSFASVRGQPYAQSVRVLPDGSLDPTYTPTPLPGVTSTRILAQQTDGKILLGGNGISGVGPGTWGRLNADGTLDSTFTYNPELRQTFGGLASLVLQPDGGVLLGRFIASTTTPDENSLALVRLQNAGGAQSLEVATGSVRWLRAGPLPEAREVAFELSTDQGQTWSPLGAGVRIAGGWEITGLSLPNRGLVRANFRPAASNTQVGTGRLTYAQPYHLVGPEIAVEQPVNRPVASGGARDFGQLVLGSSTQRTFLVRNFGTTNLTDLSLALSGPNAADFSLVTFPVPPLTGPTGTTDFAVRFAPTAPGARTATLSIANNTPGRESFQIVLTGTALPDGTPLLLTGADINANPNDYVYGTVGQPDGRVLVFGKFTSAGGRTRNGLFRTDAAGRVESAYNPNVAGVVRAVALQPDGRLLIGGAFSSVGGQPASNLARLNADGTLDATFAGSVDGEVLALVLLPDGRVVAAGAFQNSNGAPRARAARFLASGALDPGFADPQFDNQVNGLVPLPDGRLIATGFFFNASGQARQFLARLNGDGTLDPAYAPTVGGTPFTAVRQPDGRLLVGGFLTALNGVTTGSVGRLNADGSTDTSFVSGVNSFVYSLALQGDGRILVAGAFGQAGGLARTRVARLNADGSGDATFTANTQANTGDSAVYSVGLQSDGQILLGGAYDTVNGVSAPNFTRVANTFASTTLNVLGGDAVEWQRGGTAPQALRTEFELSTDGGMSWTALGAGTPLTGGWRVSGLTLPQSGQIRARAVVPGGYSNGSTGLVVQTTSFVLTPLQIWRALQGLPSDGSADLANPSGDGNANLLRYAFNTAPNAGDLLVASSAILPPNGTAGLPFVTRDGSGRLFVEFVRRRAATNPGIAYTVETGPSMNALAPLDLSAAQVVPIDATWERVTVTDPAQTAERFGRVRVTRVN